MSIESVIRANHTEEEYDAIVAAAEVAGKTVSEYFRDKKRQEIEELKAQN